MSEKEEYEKVQRSVIRYSKSVETMNAPERLQDPYLSSLTALRQAIDDLRGKRTADMNVIMNALPQ